MWEWLGVMDTNIDIENKKLNIKHILYLIWSWTFFIIAAINISILSLIFSSETVGEKLRESYFESMELLLLNTVPVLLLMFFLYFLLRRMWISHLVTAAIVMTATWVNYFKVELRDDPLLASDLGLFSEAVKISERYTINFSNEMWIVVGVLLLMTVIFFFFANPKMKHMWTGPLLAVIVAGAVTGFVWKFALDDHIYNNIDTKIEVNQFNDKEVYVSRGFVYPFLHSLNDAFPKKPDEFDVEEAKEILNSYRNNDIPEDKRVHVIGVMLEAFNDFSKFEEIKWRNDPYDVYNSLKKRSYSGKLITNIFAGGTVDTERCFLTGYSDLGDLRTATPSYVRYFNDQGYYTYGSHPSYQWFYNRENININLGFQDYYYFENRYERLTDGSIAMDNIFFDDLYDMYRDNIKKDKDKWNFSFNVTYQNHGPYEKYLTQRSHKYVSTSYSNDNEYIADNYFSGVRDTSVQIRDMMSKLDRDKEPVVLIFFGDHNPWLGDNNSVYKEFGINLDTSTTEGFLNYYETDYVIWANSAAKKKLNNDFKGKGPDIGPYYLMNELFKQCGWKGNSFMKLSNSMLRISPLMSEKGVYLINGNITIEMPPYGMDTLNKFNSAQYYLKYYEKVKSDDDKVRTES